MAAGDARGRGEPRVQPRAQRREERRVRLQGVQEGEEEVQAGLNILQKKAFWSENLKNGGFEQKIRNNRRFEPKIWKKYKLRI